MTRKWGESFLKSGLPLEHLTQVTFRSLDWSCSPSFEYSRRNREKEEAWFEVDLFARAPCYNGSTGLSVLVECKYHDLSRYWFFLPHHSEGRWRFDDRVINCGPYQTLRKPRANTFLPLAPLSSGGIVVSEDGTKQENAVHTAMEQVTNAFVPCCLDHMFMYNIDFHNVLEPADELRFEPEVTALVPLIVTNAVLYRLRPDVTDLDAIRAASAPTDVADEVPWTWYYHDVSAGLHEQNMEAIATHLKTYAELVYRFPNLEDTIQQLGDRPNWIAIVNIKSLKQAVTEIRAAFEALDTRSVAALLKPPRRRKKRS